MSHVIKPFVSRKSLKAHITALELANRAVEIMNGALYLSIQRDKAFNQVHNNDDAEQAHIEAIARIKRING